MSASAKQNDTPRTAMTVQDWMRSLIATTPAYSLTSPLKSDDWRDQSVRAMRLALDELNAALADPVLRGWRPIESAPRDGKKVLVWSKGCGHWVASYRLPMTGEPQCEAHYVKEWRDGDGRWATPTLWMPLPEPPEGK